MKKSSLKYLGVTAAALLAVAPIAAPVVSTVAQPGVTVKAADATLQTALDAAFKDASVPASTISALADSPVSLVAAGSESADYDTVKADAFLKLFNSADQGSNFGTNKIVASIEGQEASSWTVIKNVLSNSAAGATYKVDFKVIDGKGNSLASKTVNLTIQNPAATTVNATFADTTVKVGDPISGSTSVAAYTNILKDLAIKSNGTTVNVSANAITKVEYKYGDEASTTDLSTLKPVVDAGKFAQPAGFTQTITLSANDASLSAIKGNVSNDGKSGLTYDSATATYTIKRHVTVNGDNQAQLSPVYKYNGSLYGNGQTLPLDSTDTNALTLAVGGDVATAINTFIGHVTPQNSINDVNGKPLVATDVDYSKVDQTKPGTYTATISWANDKGLVSKVMFPVVITNSVSASAPVIDLGTPVNPTITVGSKFDPWAGVSATESKNNATAVPKERMSVAGSVDTSKAGQYILTYTATNVLGEKSTSVRVVTVTAGASTETGTLYVNYVPGYGIAVWNNYTADRKATDKKLAHGTAWKYFATATDENGNLWYNLGGNQWVDGKYISFTKPGNSGESNEITPITAVGTVNYVPGYGIAIWGKPAADVTSKKLAHGTSWKVFAKTTVNGTTWYNLGGNQWISGKYFILK
ncbi:immunoglobulin-like domain-containing protein [Lacticaseibacillus brantae]|uniref:NlpC P60 family protein n=1 Tax=Lacticaseibacillus brantae DSM 23927 TaxID=1423727 RepID=A0A0R2AYN5_9LACO|nr:immunoglobulin-like domain-containing protein [Lacticaseibacillus brantae]KRM72063.1 NlpC P60 family protein [Lacticaseibacillus brantae DSM 23927]